MKPASRLIDALRRSFHRRIYAYVDLLERELERARERERQAAEQAATEARTLRESGAALADRLRSLESLHATLARDLVTSAGERAAAHAELQAAQGQLAEVQDRLRTLEDANRRISSEALGFETKLAEVQAAADVARAELDRYRTGNDVTAGELAEAREERDDARRALITLEEELAKVRLRSHQIDRGVVRSAAKAPQGDTRSTLEIVCVGTGRDGTESLNAMIQALFDAEGFGRQSFHEYAARELYDSFALLKETGDERHMQRIEALIRECPHHCIVGNGYAPVMGLFAKVLGRPVKVIHLQRADRARCIDSLMWDAQQNPVAYRYYASSPDASVRRMAGFHFGEVPRKKWDTLDLGQRLEWYYDKTHRLIAAGRRTYDAYLHMRTEDLDGEEARRAIARLAVGTDAVLPAPVHLNARAPLAAIEGHPKLRWLLRDLDLGSVVADDVKLLEYALERFLAITGYQIEGKADVIDPAAAKSESEVEGDMDRARTLLQQRLGEIEDLKRKLAKKS